MTQSNAGKGEENKWLPVLSVFLDMAVRLPCCVLARDWNEEQGATKLSS